MRADIIGLGVTGTVTAELLQRLGHDVRVYDQDPAAHQRMLQKGFLANEGNPAPVTFLCIPEWDLESALSDVAEESLPVVRSTTVPGTIAKLSEETKRHICHLPEFLRESTALWDELTADHFIIGVCCPAHSQMLETLLKPMACPLVTVDTTTSETIKIVTNAYLSMLITFWNEVSLITKNLGVSSTAVGRAAMLDDRVSRYGAAMHGAPFGGRCLPKDLTALIQLSESLGHDPVVLKAVQQLNDAMADGRLDQPLPAELQDRRAT